MEILSTSQHLKQLEKDQLINVFQIKFTVNVKLEDYNYQPWLDY